MKSIFRALTIVIPTAFIASVSAHDYRAGNVAIEHPWTHVTVQGATVAPVYMIIRNGNKEADALIGASSPGLAEKVELRGLVRGSFSMSTDLVDKINIPGAGMEHLKPYAAHVILLGLKQPLKKGEQLPLTLHFKNAGKVAVKIMVEATGVDPFAQTPTPVKQ